MQAEQVLVGQVQQMIQRQPLGKLAEFIALLGADQAVQALPQVAVFFLLCNFCQQRLLAGAALVVVGQAGAVCA